LPNITHIATKFNLFAIISIELHLAF